MLYALLVARCLFLADPAAAEDLLVLPAKLDGRAPKDMMHAYLLQRAAAALDRHEAELAGLRTPEECRAYQQRMCEFFLAALGRLPERTPLSPQLVAREERDGYRVEKIIFESQPKHYVTALLYLPAAKPPYPGVLVPCGHSGNGKAHEAYQWVCILLARCGLAALSYDPIDQGERFQLLDDHGKPLVGGTTGHSALGVGSTVLGRNTATYRIWDGMRALDYLESRGDVQPKQFGCTGNSGGGTLTSYLMALDPRVQCAAPSCYLTSFRRLLETIGPQDAEQNIHGQVARGMDHAQYVVLHAPRPTLICAATQDFFDIGGTRHTFQRAKQFYTLLGAADRVAMFEAEGKHGFAQPAREAAAGWLRRWLLGVADPVSEQESKTAADKDLQCTPQGQVMLLPGARSAYDLNVELEGQLAEKRKTFWKQAGPAATALPATSAPAGRISTCRTCWGRRTWRCGRKTCWSVAGWSPDTRPARSLIPSTC